MFDIGLISVESSFAVDKLLPKTLRLSLFHVRLLLHKDNSELKPGIPPAPLGAM